MTQQFARINDHISYLDNNLLDIPGVGATYVVQGDEVALVETGTSLCVPRILARLPALGVRPADVRHILLTHVHLDHAGGAGGLAQVMPEAQVYIHSLTAPHLVDPSRLLPSAERALGDLFARHGTIVPLAPERLVAAEELRLSLGRGITLRAVPTPGHSPDHLAYFEESSGVLFTGDSIGIVMPEYHYYGPVTPPPASDIPAQHATFQTLLDMPIRQLFFSHFGPSPFPPRETIRRLQESYERFGALVRAGIEQGGVDEHAIVRALLPRQPISEEGAWAITGWIRMSIKGLMRYYTKLAGAT